jgi:hypothetical protein
MTIAIFLTVKGRLNNLITLMTNPLSRRAASSRRHMKGLANFLPALIVAFVLTGVSIAQTSRTADAFPNIKIKNVGQMDTNYYAGKMKNEQAAANKDN